MEQADGDAHHRHDRPLSRDESDLVLTTNAIAEELNQLLKMPSSQSRPQFRESAASQDTIRPTATPPVDIPAATEHPTARDASSDTSSYIQQYMRNRNPSVSFNSEIKLDSGHRQSIGEPLEKPWRDRGRPTMHPVSKERRDSRAHSESERSHFDLNTGRRIPRFSQSPPREQARIGEARFPLLQTTVDEMARESHTDLPQAQSLTSQSTAESNEEALFSPPPDDHFLQSPTTESPTTPFSHRAFSYEDSKPFRRTASQRWRDGEVGASPQDFFSRAGSLRNRSMRDIASRASRRETSGSTKSPMSAASSFLRGFSMSSSTNIGDADTGPLPPDAEGQTIGEDYVLGEQIGYGGFSKIRAVTQLQDSGQRKLAVKIVRRRISNISEAENEQAQAEFEHEVELWRFLNHRNILPLEAVYKLDEATFCFIPLNVGGTLFDLVRSNRNGVEPDVARSYAYQLASALRYLHLDARVVHRDIKLENVLIEPSPDGKAGLLRVCDFGMAEWLSSDSISGPPSPDFHDTDRPPRKHMGPADTSTSAFAGGSLEYAAPEILRIAERLKNSGPAERAIVSPAVDLWAYGVCVYSMVVGSRPFQNSFQPRVVMAILAGDWNREPLAEKGGHDVLELVTGCLDMDDTARWDISRVMESAWLEDLASDEDNLEQGLHGWRL
ncbi:hypothetical protein PV08_02036 [Exophiala spinifera]|uniref:Protein kinase domain-containing protein n=1 Tax=Exophiala spinifera TaxID=91928 RepID=A0A0D1Z1D9_9EURO|nr:uncharacterized protein PV08_02036 [Exophiala spinifera]KIW21456.1 hypothetical protein PV08_02036 [Exophiala spinifera]